MTLAILIIAVIPAAFWAGVAVVLGAPPWAVLLVAVTAWLCAICGLAICSV